MSTSTTDPAPTPSDFIRDIVADDLASGRTQRVQTRFPPEPNGCLHIGHAKSICLNFGIAHEFGGVCNLRMDDTNPTKEDVEYVESIIDDVRWLIAGWADGALGLKEKGKTPEYVNRNGKTDFYQPSIAGQGGAEHLEPFYASDYFEQIYEYAIQLIQKGNAYVDDLKPEETDSYRQEGKESPYRTRTVEENLELFRNMRAGMYPDGARTLRAKIDMQAPNMWLRDPILYRIRHAEHHHTGKAWCIYPMYDFAHGLSDYIEGVTHSICTLEFEVHRPLYDWLLEALELPRVQPRQYEFARLNLTYTLMSKRKLMQLVTEQLTTGWDDPRMPTIRGLRRRGVPAAALRAFAYHIGITKYDGLTDVAVLEHAIRDELNRTAQRRLAVLKPIKVVITNYPEDGEEVCQGVNLPSAPEATRAVPFSRELYIEQDDFMEVPAPKYFRLRPGGEVRLKYAYIIKCEEVVKDAAGQVVELRCTADLESKSGGPNANRKVKGTIHWVSARHAVPVEVRLYERLFTAAEPESGGDFRAALNPHSLETVTAYAEPALRKATAEERYQFERLGYFTLDKEGKPDALVFNRTITLKDAWAKETKKA